MEKCVGLWCVVVLVLLCGCFGGGVGDVEGKLYRVARDHSWDDRNFMGKQANLAAFFENMLRIIAEEEGFEIEFLQMTTNNLIPGLHDGDYDAILTTMKPLILHERQYVFSDPLFLIGPVLVVPEGTNVNSLEEMGGKQLAILYPWQEVIVSEQYSPYNIKMYDNVVKALEELSRGASLDGVVLDLVPAYVMCNNIYSGKLKVATSSLTDDSFRLMTLANEGHEVLISLCDEAVKEIRHEGLYKAILQKWGLHQ